MNQLRTDWTENLILCKGRILHPALLMYIRDETENIKALPIGVEQYRYSNKHPNNHQLHFHDLKRQRTRDTNKKNLKIAITQLSIQHITSHHEFHTRRHSQILLQHRSVPVGSRQCHCDFASHHIHPQQHRLHCLQNHFARTAYNVSL